MFVVNIPDSKLKWSYEFPSDVNLLDATIINEDKVVLCTDLPFLKNGKWLYSNLVLNVFDNQGKIIEKKKLNTAEVESAKIIVKDNQFVLNLDGKLINP